MNNNIKKIKVHLGKRSYPIYLGKNIFRQLPALFSHFKIGKKVMILTNPFLAKIYGKKIKGLLESKTDKEIYLYSLPLEEKNKNIGTVEKIYNALSKYNFERNSSIIALGGGVIGDITGFAAATYLRGINYFQIPTTLLAQVDSSVGGKTGLNLLAGKNLIGAFYQPKAVFIDIGTLESLPKKEWLTGLAEVIKYGVIYDQNIFKLLEQKYHLNIASQKICLKDEDLLKIIKRCCQIKANIVSKDETESGVRAILNYGHTVGHAIEIFTKHRYLHGEAVALGMVAAAYIAERKNIVKKEFVQRQRKLIQGLGLPVFIRGLHPDKLIALMKKDKKVKEAQIRFVLPVRLGKVKIFNNINMNSIKESLLRLASEKGE
ncbi:MAG: 3-dehydroquinate synthase [Candidatus Margulisbacteria bacterium]|nr:3-dehydroquinate synthase [Candidatus Margulisiibacteriota bacterium]